MSVRIDGLRETQATLDGMTSRLADLSPVLGGTVSELIEAYFLNRISNEGPGWAALAPSTLANRRRPGRGLGGIGQDTLKMWFSFQNPDAEGAVKIVTPFSVERGSAVENEKGFNYARHFHLGNRSGAPQPARPLRDDDLPSDFVLSVANAIRDHVIFGSN